MHSVKERVDELLNTPMSRQQFIKQAGAVLLAVVGVSAIVNSLDPKSSQRMGASVSDSMAYGGSVYAGKKST